MTIGEMAKEAGIGVETIRFYERKGLIAQPRRPANGFRSYDQQTVNRIRFVRHAQALGFSLAQIHDLLDLRFESGRMCSEVKWEAKNKIDDIDSRIASLRKMRKALAEITRSCPGQGPTSACPILEAIESFDRKERRNAIQER